ncbi:MAG: hypothetical protein EBY24_22910 [Betaproteobacteria bacterium]|nr:hypothetical protein [Betaproteobacteria bacterium]
MTWLLSVISALTGVILTHAVLRRLRPADNSVVQFLALAALGAGLLAWVLTRTATPPVQQLAALALLTFGCELYLFLFTFAISSVSLALLLEKTGRNDASAPVAQAPTPAARVERMLESRLLLRTPAGYALAPAGRVIVRTRQMLRNFFLHET